MTESWGEKKQPWWKFWDPRSGLGGGLVMASLLTVIYYLLVFVWE